jgi:hypothetical protein
MRTHYSHYCLIGHVGNRANSEAKEPGTKHRFSQFCITDTLLSIMHTLPLIAGLTRDERG